MKPGSPNRPAGSRPNPKPRVISVQSQTDAERAAMAVMQLEMALALAREKEMTEMIVYLEATIEEARNAHRALLS